MEDLLGRVPLALDYDAILYPVSLQVARTEFNPVIKDVVGAVPQHKQLPIAPLPAVFVRLLLRMALMLVVERTKAVAIDQTAPHTA